MFTTEWRTYGFRQTSAKDEHAPHAKHPFFLGVRGDPGQMQTAVVYMVLYNIGIIPNGDPKGTTSIWDHI